MSEAVIERQDNLDDRDSAGAGLAARYREKLKDVVATFGAPVIRASAEGSYVTGVAYARIGDFGAGHDSLLDVYLAHAMPGSVPIEDVAGAYAMEIWEAGDNGEPENALRRVYFGSIRACAQGDVLADVRLIGMDDRWWVAERRKRDDGTYETLYFSLGENGDFGEASEPPNAYHASTVRVPVASLDDLGYGIAVELAQPDNELWQIGANKPEVELGEWSIQSGWYLTTLPMKGFIPAYESVSTDYISKVSFDNGVITASGTFAHAQDYDDFFESGRAREIVGPSVWKFELSDSAEFQLRGGASGPRIVDANRFNEALGNQGMGLYLQVVDGMVVLAALSS